MAQIIACSIDLTKIDKSRIKNGKYYDFVVTVNDEKDQYGNEASITAGQTKEEREAKAKRTFIGNGRIIWQGQSNRPSNSQPAQQQSQPSSNPVDDLPF